MTWNLLRPLNDSVKNEKGFPNPEKVMTQAFLLCDNLYRRIENSDSLGLTEFRLTTVVFLWEMCRLLPGPFGERLLCADRDQFWNIPGAEKLCQEDRTHDSGFEKNKYRRNFLLTEEERNLVPKLPENYDVPEEVSDILRLFLNTPMRVFMSAGESGTGKTTNARMVAQMLGSAFYYSLRVAKVRTR